MVKFQKFLLMVMVMLAILTGWQTIAPAQSLSTLESRLSRVESDTRSLRSQISQVETALTRISTSVGIDYAVPSEIDIPGESSGSALSADPMFDRLATLVIEQRERLDALEARLTALEAGQP